MKAESLFDLRGRSAFVTGAASGIGFAMAEVLADNGASVTMADIDAGQLTSAYAKLAGRGLSVRAAVVDVADAAAIETAIADADHASGGLDIVCANAGISAGPGPMTEKGRLDSLDLAHWDKVLRVNLTGVMMTIRAASAVMRPRRRGRIIVTASEAGLKAERNCGYGYVATKAAVINLVRQAAMQLGPDNITINAIAPGPILTGIGGGRLHDDAVAASFAEDTMLGRIGSPDEIKGLTLLLASDASSFMTGSVIPVDGGVSAW